MRNAMARPAMVRLVLCGLASVVMGEEGGGVPYHALRAAGQPQVCELIIDDVCLVLFLCTCLIVWRHS